MNSTDKTSKKTPPETALDLEQERHDARLVTLSDREIVDETKAIATAWKDSIANE